MDAGDEMAGLRARYPLVEKRVDVAGRQWRVTAVEDQDALIREVRTTADLEHFPYGLMLWPSALGLAERLAEEPALVRGRRVLEIGAGVGMAGLQAGALGAGLTQTDYQEEALALCRLNAARNGVGGVAWGRMDWRSPPDDLPPFDVVLGSDVLYERTLHAALAALLPRLLAPGGLLLLSDPIRPQAFEFLDGLERGGGWSLRLEGLRVRWGGAAKEIALAFLRRVGPDR